MLLLIENGPPRTGGQMSIFLRRREFLAALGGAAAWPLSVRAQQSAIPVIGFLSSASISVPVPLAFRKGLSQAGILDENVAIEARQAQGRYDRLPALAADFIRRKRNVIVSAGG